MIFPKDEMKVTLKNADQTMAVLRDETIRTAMDLRGFIRVCTSIATRVDNILGAVEAVAVQKEKA